MHLDSELIHFYKEMPYDFLPDSKFSEFQIDCETRSSWEPFRCGVDYVAMWEALGPYTKEILDQTLRKVKCVCNQNYPVIPELTGRPAKMFRGARIASHPPGIHVAFPVRGIPDELKGLADGKNIHVGSSNQVAPVFRQRDDAGDCLIFVRRDGEAHLKEFPVSHYGGESEFMVVVLDFPSGDKLTEFIKLYLVSYILGMLARYYPSMWTALLRNEKGDFAQPLLVDAVQAIERDFAEHLSRQLSGTVRKLS